MRSRCFSLCGFTDGRNPSCCTFTFTRREAIPRNRSVFNNFHAQVFWSSQGQPINQELLATQLKLLFLVTFPHGSGGQQKKYKENMKTLCFTRVREREREKKNLAKCLGKRRTNTETIKSVGLSHLRPWNKMLQGPPSSPLPCASTWWPALPKTQFAPCKRSPTSEVEGIASVVPSRSCLMVRQLS